MVKNCKYLIIAILLFVLCPKVEASLCSDSAKVGYQNLAKNISSTYEYSEGTNTFNIIFTNIDSSLYIKNVDTEEVYNYAGNEMALFNFMPGKSYKFGIYTTNFECRRENMYTIYITLPYHNPFYQNEICNGIENYKYCKKFINKQITYDEFISNVETYKKRLEQQQIDDITKNQKNMLDYIIDFYLNNYYIILPIIIIVCLIYVYKYNKEQSLF